MSNDQTHHMQTPEGKEAATEARRRWMAEQPDMGEPTVFVVRLAGAKPYGWEIRKFGGIVLRRSETGFETQLAARSVGEKAKADMTAGTL